MPCGSAPNAIQATTKFNKKGHDKSYKKDKQDKRDRKEAFRLMNLAKYGNWEDEDL